MSPVQNYLNTNSAWITLTNSQFSVAAEPQAGREVKSLPCYLFPNTLQPPFGQDVCLMEAVMAHVLREVLLYCCQAAFVTGIVLAAASFIS